MASSNASVFEPSQNLSHDNIVALESVVTGKTSRPHDDAASESVDPERLTRHSSTHVLPPSFSMRETAGSANAILETHRAVLSRLKAWHQWEIDRYKSLSKFLMSKAGIPKRPIRPTHAQLLSLATYFFPPRRSLKVVVFDFGGNRFERFEVDLVNVQQCKSLFGSQYDDLRFEYRIRLGVQTKVGGCTVDVCFPNPNALDTTDV